jgi:hypothetical protein
MISQRMGDQKFTISSSSVLKKALMPLASPAFAVSTHQSTLNQRRGYGPFSLCVIQKENLCPAEGPLIERKKEKHLVANHTYNNKK